MAPTTLGRLVHRMSRTTCASATKLCLDSPLVPGTRVQEWAFIDVTVSQAQYFASQTKSSSDHAPEDCGDRRECSAV
jgi:hypothetical protein